MPQSAAIHAPNTVLIRRRPLLMMLLCYVTGAVIVLLGLCVRVHVGQVAHTHGVGGSRRGCVRHLLAPAVLAAGASRSAPHTACRGCRTTGFGSMPAGTPTASASSLPSEEEAGKSALERLENIPEPMSVMKESQRRLLYPAYAIPEWKVRAGLVGAGTGGQGAGWVRWGTHAASLEHHAVSLWHILQAHQAPLLLLGTPGAQFTTSCARCRHAQLGAQR
jgi:hypothetical protein